jgi:hypothetical protein
VIVSFVQASYLYRLQVPKVSFYETVDLDAGKLEEARIAEQELRLKLIEQVKELAHRRHAAPDVENQAVAEALEADAVLRKAIAGPVEASAVPWEGAERGRRRS